MWEKWVVVRKFNHAFGIANESIDWGAVRCVIHPTARSSKFVADRVEVCVVVHSNL